MVEEPKYIVYKHTAPNGKVYIGLTRRKNPNSRWRKGKGYEQNEHFYKAILKYGWDNIKHEILFTDLTSEMAEKKERELIIQYKSYDSRFGYNKDMGGFLNKIVLKGTREKLSRAQKGKKADEQTRINMSKAHKGEKCYWYGKHLSEETKKILSEKRKKPIKQYTLDGVYIKTFGSMTEIAIIYNTTIQNIYATCSKKRKSACGFVWRYDDEEDGETNGRNK